MQSEVEQLQQELDATLSMYERACEELIHAQNEVEITSGLVEIKSNIYLLDFIIFMNILNYLQYVCLYKQT